MERSDNRDADHIIEIERRSGTFLLVQAAIMMKRELLLAGLCPFFNLLYLLRMVQTLETRCLQGEVKG
ncbi:hypothetical protein MKX03_016547, partial [Papaver bracteatum]